MQIMDSLVAGMLKMPSEQCKRALAVLDEYNQTGEAPDLSDDWALDAWWASVAPVVQNSRDISAARSQAGRRGGRPRSQGMDGTPTEQQNAESEKQTESKRKQNAESEKQTESKRKQNAESEKQTKAEEEEEEEEERKVKSVDAREGADPLGEPCRPSTGYTRPTPAEVEAFVAASGGHPVDGEAFVGWYDDHGWPARGWKGTAMRWSRDERDRASGGRASPAGSRDQAASARLKARELGERYGEAGRTEEVR